MTGFAWTGGVATGVPHGSVFGPGPIGAHGSANVGTVSWGGGEEREDGFQGDAC